MRARYLAEVPFDPAQVALPLWARSLAYGAALSGASVESVLSGVAPELRAPMRAQLATIPSGDPRARARALLEARRAWFVSSRPFADEATLARLGARVIASIVASTPPSVRPSVARSFEAQSLRAATLEVRLARTCDTLALQPVLDAIARVTKQPPTARVLGALVLACTHDDTEAPAVAHAVLRSLRCAGLDPTAALRVFAADAALLVAEEAS